MKVWFNKVHESRRQVLDIAGGELTVGRDAGNTLVLASLLVSRRHAVVKLLNGELQLANVCLNSCLVGVRETLVGQLAKFKPGVRVRIWPYSLTFEAESAPHVSRSDLEAHLRSIMADLELKIHRQLLERLDLLDSEANRTRTTERILLLENNIEDVCRELNLFAPENEKLLEEVAGLSLRDLLVHQVVMEQHTQEWFDLATLTANEFDVPATLVPEREAELHNLLSVLRKALDMAGQSDLSIRIRRIEDSFADVFPKVRPHLHAELRKYLIDIGRAQC